MELFRLFGSILIDDRDALTALKDVDNQTGKTGTGFGEIAAKGAAIGAAVVAGVTAAGAGMLKLASGTSEAAAKWLELSQRTDIGVENLQRWGYAASMSGADVEKLEGGMKKLSQSMVDAKGGSDAAINAYQSLGISMQELSTMTPEQAFERTMMALADMPDSAEKNVIGNQLLGKSYMELKPLLDSGSTGIEDLKNKADELGIVMSDDNVNAAESFGDSLDSTKLALEGVKNKIIAEFLPRLQDWLNWVNDHMPQIETFMTGVLNGIAGAIQWVIDNSNWLIPVLGAAVAAFVGFSIINTVTTAMATLKTITEGQTLAQWLLNAAMDANPIGLVVLAIAALIAIGIALWQNWDTVTAKFTEAWSKITGTWGKIKEWFDEHVVEPIRGVVEKVKAFFDFDWHLPHINMPHFRISYSTEDFWGKAAEFIGLPGKPIIDVDWYKTGAIFSKPTIFNTPFGLKGVGDAASPEVVAPLSDLKKMLGSGTSIVQNLNFLESAATPFEIARQTKKANDNLIREMAT